MSLLRTSLLNGIVVAVRVGTALILNKVLAIYVGPAGYAIIGQFQNAISIVISIAGAGVATGVTKGTAEHFDNIARQKAIWRTAVRLSLVTSLFVGAGLFFARDILGDLLLHDVGMSGVFIWLALSLPAMAANNILIAMANGKKDVRVYVVSNIVGSVLILVVAGTLTYFFKLFGALVAFTISPAITVFATLLIVRRSNWMNFRDLWGALDRSALRELSGFAIMGLTSAVAIPTALIFVRERLTSSLGLSQAGYWQASWRLSDVYLMLITTTLSVYYLPRIAEIRSAREMRAEIFKVYRFVLPVVVVSSLSIFFLRDFIINSLFTPEFSPMRDLFAWQLVGDFVKIGAWVLSYIMLGRAMIRSYVATEVIFSGLFYVLTIVFVKYFGLQGVAIAYAINYFVYWVVLSLLVKIELGRMKGNSA